MNQKFFTKSTLWMVVILAVVISGAYYLKNKATIPEETFPVVDTVSLPTPLSIENEEIKEENFTGSIDRIKGDSNLAQTSREYVDEVFKEFKGQADIAVPDMRKQFGSDSPSSNYSLEISAAHTQSENAESVIIRFYTYTGGAHGNSSYKVFTTSTESGIILQLADVIRKEQQNPFTEFIKKELHNWQPGQEAYVLFPEIVESLKFESFQNWSLDDKNLILYFSQYEIGPGVLGAFEFPLPLSNISNFLK